MKNNERSFAKYVDSIKTPKPENKKYRIVEYTDETKTTVKREELAVMQYCKDELISLAKLHGFDLTKSKIIRVKD
ncbi:hypothetical protein [Streptococcus mutans]|uniref:hypothetical protein n=1 Tax=Streptococcus mutans TaxID=1309 RepID=UPI001BE6099E|nr:hypothetical protein [Streptococcus mutans]MBT3148351.1 hypothetical protein [Streptococcus mutans]